MGERGEGNIRKSGKGWRIRKKGAVGGGDIIRKKDSDIREYITLVLYMNNNEFNEF